MFDGLIKTQTPYAARAAKAEGGIEHYLTEGAVAVAFAMHPLRTVPGLMHVAIHRDGEHAKNFDFLGGWVSRASIGRRLGRKTTRGYTVPRRGRRS
jgi:hypothetical protein